MPVDAELQGILEILNASTPPAWSVEGLPEVRAMFDRVLTMLGAGPESVVTEDRDVPGPGGPLPIRIYRPEGVERPPILVFFHGGGFVVGSIDTHDRDCRLLAEGAAVMVVSVEYRLAPEHPAPAAGDDAIAALRWVAEHADELGADGSRLAVGGDSAGGNLAAVTAMRVRDEGGPALALQLLVYPVVDMTPTLENVVYDSMLENSEGYFLTLADMVFFSECYVPEAADRRDPRLSPILAANHSDLAPAVVITCEYDPLRDQGIAYAKALAGAGVDVAHTDLEGAIHGVMTMSAFTAIGRRVADETAAAVRGALY